MHFDVYSHSWVAGSMHFYVPSRSWVPGSKHFCVYFRSWEAGSMHFYVYSRSSVAGSQSRRALGRREDFRLLESRSYAYLRYSCPLGAICQRAGFALVYGIPADFTHLESVNQ